MLTYLFEARMKNGTVIRQTQEDTAFERPGKSAWWEVEQRIDDVELMLLRKDIGSEPMPVVAAVRMSDGLFELNQNQFFLSPCSVEFQRLLGGHFRPHYYRTVTKLLGSGEDPASLFSLGWQYIVDGDVRVTQMLQIY